MTTWGDLTEQHVGTDVTFTFPWESEPVTAPLVAVMGLGGFACDDDGEWPANRNVLNLGDVGPQEVQLDNRLPVELGPAEAPA